jgi:ketosteroid isomerase-like protein
MQDIKKQFLDALVAGDFAGMEQLADPDFEIREPAALPYGGIYKGVEGFRKCLGAIQGFHKTTRLDTLNTYFAPGADSMVTEMEWAGIPHNTGQEVSSKVLEQYEFRNDKVLAITLYWFDIPAYA